MKTINITIILAFMLLTTGTIFAITPDTSMHIKMPKEIKMALSKKVNFPAEASAKTLKAMLLFVLLLLQQA